MDNADYIYASDGNGEPPRMTVTVARSPGATTLTVDAITNVPAKFVATSGTLDISSGLLDPATILVFKGHTEAGKIEIDEFAPGYSDVDGNSVGQVVVLKPSTLWADIVAASVKASFNPAGIVTQFAGSTAPSGWLLCDGSAVSRTDYAGLFAAIGTDYGVGDGSTTFNIPNLKGKVAVGLDSADTTFDTLGETGGEKTHVLTEAEMPSHVHSVDPPNTTTSTDAHTHTYSAWRSGSYPAGGILGGGGLYGNPPISTGTTSSDSHNHTVNIAAFNSATAGSGTAHNNLQPYLVLNYLIKT